MTAKKCQQCGKPFEGEAWQKLCVPCFKRSKQTAPTAQVAFTPERLPLNAEVRILRQVLLKIASEQVKGDPGRLAEYAKRLEREITGWL